MAKNHMTRCSLSYVIRYQWKQQWDTTTIYQNVQNPKKLPTPNAGEDVDQQELSLTAGGNVKWCSHFGRQSGSFQKTKPTLTIWSNNHAPWYTSKGIENLSPYKSLHANGYSSYNCQNLKATKTSFVEWMGKWTLLGCPNKWSIIYL